MRWLAGLAATGAILLGFAALRQPDGMAAAPSRALLIGVVGVALTALATLFGLARSSHAPPPLQGRLALVLLPVGAFFSLIWIAHGLLPLPPPSSAGSGAMPLSTCLGQAVLLAAVAMGALALLWRHTDPFTPRLTGAVIGGWAGVIAATGLTMACPSTQAVHVLLGHGAAVVGGVIVGMMVGRRVLSP